MGFEKDPADPLDERGSNLSMGERQILAFARAIEKRPDLWILDEATANVDSETEKKLGRELDVATQGKTLIMIAHRLATIRKSDVILVLHRGELVEQGNHDSLLRKGGYYARLHRYQEILEAGERAQTGSAHENQP
jgi:ATP-binding cassette subfamily B protein